MALEWGQRGGEAAGGDLAPQSSPAGSRPAGSRVTGRQGPAPKPGPAEGRYPQRTPPPSPTRLPKGRWPTAAVGPRARGTFMIEKQLEWRQETHDYLGRITWGVVGGA